MASFTGTTDADTLAGGVDSDTLAGGGGGDRLTGGGGIDLFAFSSGDSSARARSPTRRCWT